MPAAEAVSALLVAGIGAALLATVEADLDARQQFNAVHHDVLQGWGRQTKRKHRGEAEHSAKAVDVTD